MHNYWVKHVCISVFTLLLIAGTGLARDGKKLQTTPAYTLLNKLIRVPDQVTVHQLSSHNKQGFNSDENWDLYKDEHGDQVIFDVAGPGCIRSIWGTYYDSEAIIKFYFDGEKKPSYEMNYIDFFKGKNRDFPSPLNSYERRGTCCIDDPSAGNSFVPIFFDEHLKITIEGKSRFFHILYELYPYKTPVKKFPNREENKIIEDSFARLGEAPIDTVNLQRISTTIPEITPETRDTLLYIPDAAGIVRRIDIEGEATKNFFQNTEIRMHWDDHVRLDVKAPIGMFFGSAVEPNDMNSLPLRVKQLDNGRVRLSCYFPMPFWHNAKIEIVNVSEYWNGPVDATVYVSENPVEKSEGTYFTTEYNSGKTTYGKDWPFYEGQGTGWFVGAVQSMQYQHYCEGDEHFHIDGAISPQINGTGSEDYFLSCFWPNVDFDTPFGCVVGNILEQGGGYWRGAYRTPSCYTRYHLEAPIPFYSSIDAKIQHGGLSNISSDYRSLGFCYIQKEKALYQTDYIDVGNAGSEEMHKYTAPASDSATQLQAHPEGNNFEVTLVESGRYHRSGEISFTAIIDPENDGVKLRRRLDQIVPRQNAKVYIDEEYAGTWYHGYQNEYLRWYDSDFEIHPDFTSGKNVIRVKLQVEPNGQDTAFSDFQYEIFTYRN